MRSRIWAALTLMGCQPLVEPRAVVCSAGGRTFKAFVRLESDYALYTRDLVITTLKAERNSQGVTLRDGYGDIVSFGPEFRTARVTGEAERYACRPDPSPPRAPEMPQRRRF